MSAVHCSSASTEGNSYAQSDLDSNLTPVVDTIGNNECQRYDNSTTKRKFCWPKFDRKRSEKIAIFFLMCLHYLVISIAFSIIGPFFPVKVTIRSITITCSRYMLFIKNASIVLGEPIYRLLLKEYQAWLLD